MDLFEFISDPQRRAALAESTGSSPDYLWQVATNRRRASTSLAQRIAANSPVTKESLRPDVWTPPVEQRKRPGRRAA